MRKHLSEYFYRFSEIMYYCYACGEVGKGVFSFPQDKEKLSMWCQSLGIRDPIPKNVRICSEHFYSSEILVTSNGKRLIKKGAIPIEAVNSKAPSTDHNYAKNSKNESETFFHGKYFCWPFLVSTYC